MEFDLPFVISCRMSWIHCGVVVVLPIPCHHVFHWCPALCNISILCECSLKLSNVMQPMSHHDVLICYSCFSSLPWYHLLCCVIGDTNITRMRCWQYHVPCLVVASISIVIALSSWCRVVALEMNINPISASSVIHACVVSSDIRIGNNPNTGDANRSVQE